MADRSPQLFIAIAVFYLQAASFFGPADRRQSLFHSGSGPGRDDALGNATDPSLTEGAVARVEPMEWLRFICGLCKTVFYVIFLQGFFSFCLFPF